MLARGGKLPTRGEWAYEVKWDGFRALVSRPRAVYKSRLVSGRA
jgi:ATP-dependent DNA ligase